MRIRIFYQNFAINLLALDAASLKLKPEIAFYIWDADVEPNGGFTEGDAERIYLRMNRLDIPPMHRYRKIFEAAGHTSMSVGDFIWVPDEQVIWMVGVIGWRIWTKQELTEKFGEQIFNLLNGFSVRYGTSAFL